MIGVEVNASTYDFMRWARRMVRLLELKPREAAVLYALCSYANREGKAWPSIKTLAGDLGYKPTRGGTCSAISAALEELRNRGVIWYGRQRSRQTTVRELLYRPAVVVPDPPSVTTEEPPSAVAEEKNQHLRATTTTTTTPSSHFVRGREEPEPPSVSEEGGEQRRPREKARIAAPVAFGSVLEELGIDAA